MEQIYTPPEILVEYISDFGTTNLAKDLNCTKGLVCHWKAGRNKVGVKFAVRLERHSRGRLTKEMLRPDIFVDAA